MFQEPNEKDFDALVAENRFITDLQVVIERALDRAGLSQAEFARALGVSDARVSQILSDNGQNLEARTIARVAYVLGLRALIGFVDHADERVECTTEPKPRRTEFDEWIKSLQGVPTRGWEMACNDDDALELEVAAA